jgi:hypothetical protein
MRPPTQRKNNFADRYALFIVATALEERGVLRFRPVGDVATDQALIEIYWKARNDFIRECRKLCPERYDDCAVCDLREPASADKRRNILFFILAALPTVCFAYKVQVKGRTTINSFQQRSTELNRIIITNSPNMSNEDLTVLCTATIDFVRSASAPSVEATIDAIDYHLMKLTIPPKCRWVVDAIVGNLLASEKAMTLLGITPGRVRAAERR